jgi:hypothetical protein
MLNLWRGLLCPSINVTFNQIMNSCSEESLASLSILVLPSYLQQNRRMRSLMNYKSKKQKKKEMNQLRSLARLSIFVMPPIYVITL